MTNCRQSGRFKDWKIKPEDGCRDTDVPWRTPSNVNALQWLKQLLLKSFSLVFMPLLHFSSKWLTLCLWLRCAAPVSAQFQGRASNTQEPSPSKTASASSGGWGGIFCGWRLGDKRFNMSEPRCTMGEQTQWDLQIHSGDGVLPGMCSGWPSNLSSVSF